MHVYLRSLRYLMALACFVTTPVSFAEQDTPDYSASFALSPIESHQIIHGEALDAFFGRYLEAKTHKAFAQSEGGAWGYVTKRESVEQAKSDALAKCVEYNTRHQKTAPCRLVIADETWTDSVIDLNEIIARLPKWQPTDSDEIKNLRMDIRGEDKEENFPLALSKQLWYHHHILEHRPNASAVRLSFGLGTWKELGNKYPPAKTLLNAYGFNLLQRFKAGPPDNFSLVHEIVAINRTLGRENRSLALFLYLRKTHPQIASRYFSLFEDAVLARKRYSLYNEYISPKADYTSALDHYFNIVQHHSSDPNRSKTDIEKYKHNTLVTFANKVGTLIAVLVKNQRLTEAQAMAEEAKEDVESGLLNEVIEAALNGEIPEVSYR